MNLPFRIISAVVSTTAPFLSRETNGALDLLDALMNHLVRSSLRRGKADPAIALIPAPLLSLS